MMANAHLSHGFMTCVFWFDFGNPYVPCVGGYGALFLVRHLQLVT